MTQYEKTLGHGWLMYIGIVDQHKHDMTHKSRQ